LCPDQGAADIAQMQQLPGFGDLARPRRVIHPPGAVEALQAVGLGVIAQRGQGGVLPGVGGGEQPLVECRRIQGGRGLRGGGQRQPAFGGVAGDRREPVGHRLRQHYLAVGADLEGFRVVHAVPDVQRSEDVLRVGREVGVDVDLGVATVFVGGRNRPGVDPVLSGGRFPVFLAFAQDQDVGDRVGAGDPAERLRRQAHRAHQVRSLGHVAPCPLGCAVHREV